MCATYYWAFLDKLQIVADIPDAEEFWHLQPAEQSATLNKLRQYRVKAVVLNWESPRPAPLPKGWSYLQPSKFLVYLLN